MECWKKLGLWPVLQWLQNNHLPFSTTVLSFLQVANQDHHQVVFSTILWSLWKSRNNHFWNQTVDSQDTICNRAILLLV